MGVVAWKRATCQQGGAYPLGQTAEPCGTTIVLLAGRDGLLLLKLRQPAKASGSSNISNFGDIVIPFRPLAHATVRSRRYPLRVSIITGEAGETTGVF